MNINVTLLIIIEMTQLICYILKPTVTAGVIVAGAGRYVLSIV